jgi:hypothetical protein
MACVSVGMKSDGLAGHAARACEDGQERTLPQTHDLTLACLQIAHGEAHVALVHEPAHHARGARLDQRGGPTRDGDAVERRESTCHVGDLHERGATRVEPGQPSRRRRRGRQVDRRRTAVRVHVVQMAVRLEPVDEAIAVRRPRDLTDVLAGRAEPDTSRAGVEGRHRQQPDGRAVERARGHGNAVGGERRAECARLRLLRGGRRLSREAARVRGRYERERANHARRSHRSPPSRG